MNQNPLPFPILKGCEQDFFTAAFTQSASYVSVGVALPTLFHDFAFGGSVL